MNTFEMLYVQKKQKIIANDVWDPWKKYFIEVLKEKEGYEDIWKTLKNKNLFHEGLIEIIDKELSIS